MKNLKRVVYKYENKQWVKSDMCEFNICCRNRMNMRYKIIELKHNRWRYFLNEKGHGYSYVNIYINVMKYEWKSKRLY